MKTRFILIETSHAGNVGAAARAMKTMGFDDLVLVRPRWANVLRRQETIQRASGALDVLEQARIVDSLDQALHGLHHLCATAMTPRDFGPPTAAPRAHFEALLANVAAQPALTPAPPPPTAETATAAPTTTEATEALAPQPFGLGLLFGCERFGMSNEDVYRCHVALSIPTNPQFGSLNLGAAIQLLAYEWRQALGGFAIEERTAPTQAADAAQIAGMLGHWQEALTHLGFLDPQAPKKLMPRLQQILNRSQLSGQEIQLLRGIAKTMLRSQPPIYKK
ncbi:MAG: RNA methyltransferase [Comamonas sp.]|nr:RNA methyltransferase [Comamonas sp.]